MSADLVAVRFPDGEVRWTLYNVVDEVVRELSTTPDPVREAWHAWGGDVEPMGPIYDVEIYSNYGFGFWWTGRSARNCIVEGWDTMVDPPMEYRPNEGRPRWVEEAMLQLGESPVTTVAIRFPDGTVRWTLKKVLIVPRLADTFDEVYDAFLGWDGDPEVIGEVFDVDLSYGGIANYRAKAAVNVLVGQPHYTDHVGGRAEWAERARFDAGAEATERGRGIEPWPDWSEHNRRAERWRRRHGHTEEE